MGEDVIFLAKIEALRMLLDHGTTAITVLDTHLRVLCQYCAEQTPFACESNDSFCDLFSLQTSQWIEGVLQQVIASKEAQTLETEHEGGQIYRHDVKLMHFSQTCPVIVVYSTEITLEKQQAADAHRFRTIFANSIDGIIINRKDKSATNATAFESNAATTRITGYSPEEIRILPLEKLYPRDEYNDVIRRRIAGDQDLVERRFLHKNGTLGWIQSMGVKSQDGEIVEWIVLVRDITEQKRLENELREASQRFKSLADSLPASVIWIDTEENYLYVNQYAARSVGMSQDAFAGLKLTDVVKDPRIVRQWRDQLAAVLETQDIVTSEYTFESGGETHHRLITLVPQFNENGRITSAISHSVDLSELYKREAALREAKAQAEQATKVKDRFIANINHELRTPLNVMLGFAGLLYDDEDFDNGAREYLHLIIESGRQLARLVDDMLNASQLDLANFYLSETAVNLHHLIQHIVRSQVERTNAKGIALTAALAPNVPEWIQTDDIRLRQIINNLVDNAFKYSQRGSIEINVTCRDDLTNLHIEVLDQGDGIPEPMLERIFEAFITLGESSTNSGIGLGLYITRSLVHLMGGGITAQNRPEGGSVFLIDLPLHPSNPDDIARTFTKMEPVRLAQNSAEYRITIVEDVVANAVVLEKQLTKWGFLVDVVLDSGNALERMRQTEPDLILLDLYMPNLDGFTLARLIRKDDTLCRVPIIAVTASAVAAHYEQALASGCDDFVLKPVQYDLLAKKLEDLLDIEFVYRPRPDLFATEAPPSLEMLTRQELQLMPTHWLRQLYAAAATASTDRIQILITEIEREHPAIGEKIQHLLSTFNHSQIADLLEDVVDKY
jgi:PAS domain S-box-containing protein